MIGSLSQSAFSRFGIAVLAVAVVAVTLTAFPGSARAETVTELEGAWALGTPGEIQTGDSVNAQWWLNLNDDTEEPGNEPVPNVTFTVALDNAIFPEIPAACLTEGVDPPSEISADGAILTCNLGEQDDGSALTLTTALEVTGRSGDAISASATFGDDQVDLEEFPINNPMLQDIRWAANAGKQAVGSNSRDISFNWTLFHRTDSPVGPDSVTYDLTPSNSLAASMAVGPVACPVVTLKWFQRTPRKGAC